MITAAQVRKRYGDAWALYPTDLAVEAGQRVAIVGPSGCGKSTLMRILGGLLSPDGGAVTLEGRPFTIEARLEQRRAVGYVVQDGGLFPHLTAEENVTLVARHLGLAPAARKARLDTLASLVRLGADALARYPKGLSGGERQRVSLMRALFLEPSVLLLDEPFSALDPITRRGLQRELEAIVHTLGKTVVLVTHDLDEAAFLGKELLLMRGGAIVQRGTFADLRDRPRDAWVTEFVNAGAPLCPIEAR